MSKNNIINNYVAYYNAQEQQKQYNTFVHFTPHINSIIQDNLILSSGGGLGYGIYTTPLIKEKEHYKIHNLGDYIFNYEIPFYTKQKTPKKCLIFQVYENNIGIITHNDFGNIYSQSISNNQKNKYNTILPIDIRNSKNFNIFNELKREMHSGLHSIYFDSVQDFILLFQQTHQSILEMIYKRELYTFGFKKRLFNNQSYLVSGFTTKKFFISIEDFKDILILFNVQYSLEEAQRILTDIFLKKLQRISLGKGGMSGFLLNRESGKEILSELDLGKMLWNETGRFSIYGYDIPKGEYLISGFIENDDYKVFIGEYDNETQSIKKISNSKIKIIPKSVSDKLVTLRKK